MRTKYLLMAAALPALFAACTNDDFESVADNGAAVADGRKVVENVVLDFSTSEADTRLAYNPSATNPYTWHAGDAIGACLMDEITDEYNNPWASWSDRFELVDYIQTNYKFTRGTGTNAAWTTEAKMLEGNYFFVYPYDARFGTRNAYEFNNSIQTIAGTDNASLLKAYTENNGFVGFGRVQQGEETRESMNIGMVPVFASTGITIKNTGTNTYTIKRIVLRGTKVSGVAVIDPTSCTPATQWGQGAADTKTNFNIQNYVGEDDGKHYVNSENFGRKAYNGTTALKDVLDPKEGAIEVFVEKGGTIATQKSINILVMSVAAKLEEDKENEILMDVYSDKGMVRGIALNHRYTSADTNESWNVITDKALTALGNAEKVQVDIDDTQFDKVTELEVDSSEDLRALVTWRASIDAPITAKLSGNVTITKDIADMIVNGKAALTFESVPESYTYTDENTNGEVTTYSRKSVTIAADAPAGTLDKISFAADRKSDDGEGYGVAAVYVEGTQTLSKDKTTTRIVVNGTLNVTAKTSIQAIQNWGTVNVNAELNSSDEKAIENWGTIEVAANKTVNAKVINGYYLSDYDYNPGTITNAGTIKNLVSNAKKSIIKVTATGVIGTAQVAPAGITAGENFGTIENTGKVYLMRNVGDIRALATSTTMVNINRNSAKDGDGKYTYGSIIITALNENGNIRANDTATDDRVGNIVQEIAAAATTDTVDKRANTIWLSAALTVAENKNKDGNLQDVNLTTVTFVATGANASIVGNGVDQTGKGQSLRIKGLEVNADAALTLNKSRIVVSTENITMRGYKSHVATLNVNSNAALYSDGGKKTLTVNNGGASATGYNVVNNLSAHTNF